MEQILIAIFKGIYYLGYELYFSLFIKPKITPLLKRYSRYYNALVVDEKNEFRRIVWDFVWYNKFVGRGNLRVKLPLKVLIASHAMQLAFGLPEECYDYYEKIILYKDYYLSRLTGKYHKAEVNPSFRVIVFSMRAIHESLNRDDDGLNVLLHEFAHALWLEHLLKGHEYKIFSDRHFKDIRSMISEALKDGSSQSHFFRKYAFANEAEFFAVAVENFFERPHPFREALPEFYEGLTRLLNQDPCNLNHNLRNS